MSDNKEILLIRTLSQEARWCGHCVYCPCGSDSPATSGTLCFLYQTVLSLYNVLSQLWECEKPREEGGQPGLGLGSLRGHLEAGDRGDRELGCCK